MPVELVPFPGTALVVAPDGEIRDARAGFEAPISIDDVVGRPLHEVLGLPPESHESATLQLWLATGDRVPLDLWRMSLLDPPRSLPARSGRPALQLEYTPVVEQGEVRGVAVIARAATERARSTATMSAVADPTILDGRVTAAFARSASDLLSQAEAAVTRIAADREARSALQRLFRAIHTLKGEAQALDLREIRDLAHGVEDLLAALRAADIPIGTEELDRIRGGISRMRAAIVSAVGSAIDQADAMSTFHAHARPLLARMQRCLERWTERPRIRRYGDELRRITSTLVEHATRAHLRVYTARARSLAAMIDGCMAANRLQRSVLARIEAQVDELDMCLGLCQQVHLEIASSDTAGEIVAMLREWRPQVSANSVVLGDIGERLAAAGVVVVARCLEHDRGARAALIPGVLADTPAMFEPAAADANAPPRDEALEALRSAVSLCDTLATDPESRELAARLRTDLYRIESVLTRVSLEDLGAMVTQNAHGLAAELGKQVHVEVDTLGVRVRPEVLRAAGEALLHAVRNAIDHGIEAPAQRLAAGKPATARIDVAAEIHGDRLVIEIRDDGRGVDLERVRRCAIERELMAPEVAEATPSDQLLELLFRPAFSTASAVTHVSGRGVGLDAIRASVEELGGHVSIATAPGAGTCLRLEIPDDRPS